MTASYYVSGEWEYPPEYPHALHRYASETLGIDDVSFHSTLSSEGNAGRAFTSAQYTKLQEIGRVPKPPFELTDASVEPTQLSVGDAVTATARVENTGGSRGPIDIRLSFDGDIVASETVTVSPGESVAVELSHRVQDPGSHTVEVNQDHSRTVQVQGSTSTRQTTRITTTVPPATATPTQTTSASTPTRPASEGNSVGGTGPGFGIWSAIGGAGGTALLLKLLGRIGGESED